MSIIIIFNFSLLNPVTPFTNLVPFRMTSQQKIEPSLKAEHQVPSARARVSQFRFPVLTPPLLPAYP